jgi:ketosteroid isomerase-like protein
MSKANVEIVRRSFEAHQAGGIEAALNFYAPDFVWDAGPDWFEERIYRGHDGARRLDAIFAGNFEAYSLAVHEIRAVGDHVLALYEASGRIRDSGLPLRQPVGIVVSDFENEKIGKVRSYFSWRDARRAIGLEDFPLSANLDLVRCVNTKRNKEARCRRSDHRMRCCIGDGGAGRLAGGPPRPPCRGRPQTAPNCCGQEPWW